MFRYIITSLLAIGVASAWEAPIYPGYTKVWQDTFSSSFSMQPNLSDWNIITGDLGVNNELQVYTSSSANVQLKGWTSGRIESQYSLTPANGKITRIEAFIMFGENLPVNKQEIDVMEAINGILTGHGTVHCDTCSGGITGTIKIPDQAWHLWRVEIGRREPNYQDEAIIWYLDGNQFHKVTGSHLGSPDAWAVLTQSPLFIIFNVAVGGDWPGYPKSNTLDGYGSRMEVAYVAHYTSI
uniref:GH16 domain-containing protein n=1 Tax=Bionectria ochroleuca TaxID=29856 RepID=A0A8H7K6N6_BIOOC